MALTAEYALGAVEYVSVAWTSEDDLTISPVFMALVQPGFTPDVGDWVPAQWTPSKPNRSRTLLDTTDYGVGLWSVWGKVVDSPETVIRQHGTVRII
jgi:hypothetical protein